MQREWKKEKKHQCSEVTNLSLITDFKRKVGKLIKYPCLFCRGFFPKMCTIKDSFTQFEVLYGSCSYCIKVLQNRKVFNFTMYFWEADVSFASMLQRGENSEKYSELMSDGLHTLIKHDESGYFWIRMWLVGHPFSKNKSNCLFESFSNYYYYYYYYYCYYYYYYYYYMKVLLETTDIQMSSDQQTGKSWCIRHW